jgi:prepilin-type N-terminal cleavage/methylation domain-containing protein
MKALVTLGLGYTVAMHYFSRRNTISFGLSLIEILVVLAIIGLLVSVVTASFSQSRAQARDKVRMTSLKELQLAIEQYKAQNGVYPIEGCGSTDTWTGPGPHPAAWGNDVHCADYIVGLVPDYITALPNDPTAEMVDDRGFIYQVNADRSAYKVLVHRSVESLLVTSFANAFARCPAAVGACAGGIAGENNIYAVYSPGAENW